MICDQIGWFVVGRWVASWEAWPGSSECLEGDSVHFAARFAGGERASEEQGLRHGFVVRPFVTLGVIAVYCRYGRLFDEAQSLHDFGLLLEFPIPMGVGMAPEAPPLPAPLVVSSASDPTVVPR